MAPSSPVPGSGADLGGGCRGCTPPPPPEMTRGFLIQLVFFQKKTMWFVGVEVEQETSAPLLKKIGYSFMLRLRQIDISFM